MEKLKERPRCRKKIEELMIEKNWTIEDILKIPRHRISDGLRLQAKKMALEESKNKG